MAQVIEYLVFLYLPYKDLPKYSEVLQNKGFWRQRLEDEYKIPRSQSNKIEDPRRFYENLLLSYYDLLLQEKEYHNKGSFVITEILNSQDLWLALSEQNRELKVRVTDRQAYEKHWIDHMSAQGYHFELGALSLPFPSDNMSNDYIIVSYLVGYIHFNCPVKDLDPELMRNLIHYKEWIRYSLDLHRGKVLTNKHPFFTLFTKEMIDHAVAMGMPSHTLYNQLFPRVGCKKGNEFCEHLFNFYFTEELYMRVKAHIAELRYTYKMHPYLVHDTIEFLTKQLQKKDKPSEKVS